MANAGADIAKLAVMPAAPADAARLLEATALAAERRPETPLITMAMGPLGAVTPRVRRGVRRLRQLRHRRGRQRPRPARRRRPARRPAGPERLRPGVSRGKAVF